MIDRIALQDRAREWQLSEEVVEKDYVLGWMLWGIGTHPVLGEQWIFKGGTCLKKCYVETYRFSEDLDFTILPGGPVRPEDVERCVRDVWSRVTDESGVDLGGQAPMYKGDPSGQYTEARIYYQGPRGSRKVGRKPAVHNRASRMPAVSAIHPASQVCTKCTASPAPA